MEADNTRLATVIATQQEIAGMELNLEAILNLVARRAHELSLADGADLEIAGTDELVVQAATGLAVSQLNNRQKPTGFISELNFHKGQLLYSEDTETDERVNQTLCRQLGFRSVLAVPLPPTDGKVVGFLEVFSQKVAAFDNQDIQALQLLAGFAGTALRQNREVELHHELNAELARRAALEAELQQTLTQEKDLFHNTNRFISIISHDFRTPLTAIQSSTELLQYYSERFSATKKTEIYERVHSSVRHLTELLDNIALIGKARVGNLRFQPESISPDDLCKSLLSEIGSADAANSRLVYSGPAENNLFLLDKNLIRLLLWQLLTNALRYSPEESKVELTLATQPDEVIFSVKDSGIGIPVQDQSRIFETFFRGSNVSNVRGSGMGLTIVRYCLDFHSGSIDFSSEVDQGSIFTVRLSTIQSTPPL